MHGQITHSTVRQWRGWQDRRRETYTLPCARNAKTTRGKNNTKGLGYRVNLVIYICHSETSWNCRTAVKGLRNLRT